jgi:uncharacterized RDD family membrane protein YckC
MTYCANCGAELPEGAVYCQNCGTPVKGAAKPRLILAGWGERFAAWLIDFIIVGVFLSPTKFFFTWVGWPIFFWAPPYIRWIPFVYFGLDNLIYFLYWMLMEGIYGQSIGKMALRLKVTRLDGEQPDVGYAAIESIGKAFLLPLDCIIGWILYSTKKQRLFNYISETVIVKTTR